MNGDGYTIILITIGGVGGRKDRGKKRAVHDM